MEQSRTYIPNMHAEYMYIAQFSHEIRNPLTLINSTIQLLNYRYPKLKKDDLWTQLQDDVNYLKQLTLSLSDYNHCDQLHISAVSIPALLNNVIKPYQSTAKSQKKHILLSLAQELPVIYCDEIKIRQALINLLKNALEATSAGATIEISARCNSKRLILAIKDTGKGIKEEQISRIFQPFVTDKADGSGMGLAITRKIIFLHKGAIKVYSRENIGTKFVIFLPISQAQTPDRQK